MKQFIRSKQIDGLVECALKVGDRVELGYNRQSTRVELEVEFISRFNTAMGSVEGIRIFFKHKTGSGQKVVVTNVPGDTRVNTTVYPTDGNLFECDDKYRSSRTDNGVYLCKINLCGGKSEVNLDTLAYTTRKKQMVHTPVQAGEKFNTVNHGFTVIAVGTDGSLFVERENGTTHIFRTNDESLVKSMRDITVGEPSEE